MFFRRLIPAPQTGALTRGNRAPDLYKSSWRRTIQPNVAGAGIFAFDTFMAQPQSIIGAASPARRTMSAIGSPPMVADKTVQLVGQSIRAGQFLGTPLSQKASDA